MVERMATRIDYHSYHKELRSMSSVCLISGVTQSKSSAIESFSIRTFTAQVLATSTPTCERGSQGCLEARHQGLGIKLDLAYSNQHRHVSRPGFSLQQKSSRSRGVSTITGRNASTWSFSSTPCRSSPVELKNASPADLAQRDRPVQERTQRQ